MPMVGAVRNPTNAVAVTAWPACPSEMPSDAAMDGRRLGGRNSASTSTKLVAIMTATDAQAVRSRGVPATGTEPVRGESRVSGVLMLPV